MPGDSQALIAQGERALAEGDWPAALDHFRAALDEDESATALAGLGQALWWLGRPREAVDYMERAFAEFRREGNPGGAAMIAVRLVVHHRASLGNAAASSGWVGRLTRLLEEHDLEPLKGWGPLLEAYAASDPRQGEALARQAYELAREQGDLDLELCALSQLGTALIGQGDVAKGVRHLDEAMAGSLGGGGGGRLPDTVVYTSCNTLTSCVACAEFERAVEWVRAADRFTEQYGGPFLYAECRTLHGALLVAVGDWVQAEEELTAAIDASRNAIPGLHAQALGNLAELRLAQGRVEAAERLVEGLEELPGVAAVRAAIHLIRRRTASAENVLRRALADVGAERLEALVLVELLGETLMAAGDTKAALEQGHTLAEYGRRRECTVALARGERLCGHAYASTDAERARTHLDRALTTFAGLGMPYETARTRLALAFVLRESSPDAAVDEARIARNDLAALGAERDADRAAALLRELGVTAPAGARASGTLTAREREVLDLLGVGFSNPEIAERLYLSRKTVEHHVARILTKLGLRSRTEAAAQAVRDGLVSSHTDGRTR